MKTGKIFNRLFLLILVLVILGLILPVANLLMDPPSSAKLAALPGEDATFTRAREILQAKCSHCHADDVDAPFYASLPVAGGHIEKDIELGLKYIDLPACFDNDAKIASEVGLAKVEYALDQGTMPPTPYVLMHWKASLSTEDTDDLLYWVRQTRAKHYAPAGLDENLRQAVIQPVPATHKQKAAVVALGKALYNDKRLSKDNSISCATCHLLEKGGTDQEAVATGVGDAKGPINSPTVYNAVFNVKQFWDGRAKDLQDQAAGPVENPIEMAEKWDNVIDKLKKDTEFVAAFEKEFPAGLSKATATAAIAAFEKTLITPNCKFDKFLQGDDKALTADEKAGWTLFQENGCATCHCGKAMGGQSFELMGRAENYFAARGKKVADVDHGLFNVTKKEADRYKFKVPTLRNIAVTFPYFHDAEAKDLKTATQHMAKFQYGKELSDADAGKIVAFLETLTGEYEGKLLAGKPAEK